MTGLELRRDGDGSALLTGQFPYGQQTVLSDGGPGGRARIEVIAPRAFAYRIEQEREDIYLLVGHAFDRPLASKRNGTLQLQDTAEALSFEAQIPPEVADTSHGRDALALIRSGLSVGVSPGFRLPPETLVPRDQAEAIETDLDRPNAIRRTVRQAMLHELSIVTRPAYPEAQIEARSWTPGTVAQLKRRLLL